MILLRRAAVIVSLVALCASPALARRAATNNPEENATRSQPHTPATPIAEPVAPRANAPGNVNPDEPPTCLTAPPNRMLPARLETGRTSTPEPTRQPIAPEQSQERREKAKPTVSPTTRVAPRHTPQKHSRISSRPLPATPGMGALIRMGMTVGREISFLDDPALSRSSRPHAGRAPPEKRNTSIVLASPAAPQCRASLPSPSLASPASSIATQMLPNHARDAQGAARARLDRAAWILASIPGGFLA